MYMTEVVRRVGAHLLSTVRDPPRAPNMKIVWRQVLGDGYLTRWVIDFGFGSLRLHKWSGSDDLRNPHDHAWDFMTVILKGLYEDVSPKGNEYCYTGTIKRRKAEHIHSVKLLSKTCWTLLFCGRERRPWGFWVKGKFVNRKRYFFKYGHH